MSKQIEAMNLGIEALENAKELIALVQEFAIQLGIPGKKVRLGETLIFDRAIFSLKEALAEQPEPLPVKTYSGGKAWHVAPTQPLTDEQIDAEFDAFASKFDHESNEWLDMGVDAYFRAGFKAAHGITKDQK